MNKFFILPILLLSSIQVVAADIKDSLYKDKASYFSFLDLGKAYCLDNLVQRTKVYKIRNQDRSLYSKHFDALYALQSPLAYHYRDDGMKKVFADYQSKNLDLIIKKYREREEYFNINRSPFLICSKLFAENAETKKLYRDFLYHPNFYLKNSHPESVKRMEATIGKWTDNP